MNLTHFFWSFPKNSSQTWGISNQKKNRETQAGTPTATRKLVCDLSKDSRARFLAIPTAIKLCYDDSWVCWIFICEIWYSRGCSPIVRFDHISPFRCNLDKGTERENHGPPQAIFHTIARWGDFWIQSATSGTGDINYEMQWLQFQMYPWIGLGWLGKHISPSMFGAKPTL